MGKFSGKVTAEFNPPRRWVLTKPLSYDATDSKGLQTWALEKVGVEVSDTKITVPKGFVTDLASVPRICWAFIAPWDVARAAIIHDLLYKTIRQYRWNNKNLVENKSTIRLAKKAADSIFHQGMKDAEPKVPNWKIYCAWKAVDLFGDKSIIPNKDNI